MSNSVYRTVPIFYLSGFGFVWGAMCFVLVG